MANIRIRVSQPQHYCYVGPDNSWLWGHPVPCGMFRNPGLYPLYARRTHTTLSPHPSIVTTNVSRYCQMSPGEGPNRSWLRTIVLNKDYDSCLLVLCHCIACWYLENKTAM